MAATVEIAKGQNMDVTIKRRASLALNDSLNDGF
jgi:hypothetical protein